MAHALEFSICPGFIVIPSGLILLFYCYETAIPACAAVTWVAMIGAYRSLQLRHQTEQPFFLIAYHRMLRCQLHDQTSHQFLE